MIFNRNREFNEVQESLKFLGVIFHFSFCHISFLLQVRQFYELLGIFSKILLTLKLIEYCKDTTQTFLTCFPLNAGEWKLVPGSFMILLKRHYSNIWPFLTVDIYHFHMSLIHHFKKMKHWNPDIIGY